MSRTKMRQLEQIANSQNYNDGYANAFTVSVAEPGDLDYSIEYDLNILRTQIKNLKGTDSWFSSIDSGITDGYSLTAIKQRLDNMQAFVGSADGTDSNPDYGSINNYDQNVSLESAISALDQYLGNIKGGFAGTRILSGMTDGYKALQRLDEGYASAQDEIDRLEAALGPVVDAAGDYVARNDTNYINSLSSVDADLRALDQAIKAVDDAINTSVSLEDGYIRAFIGKDGGGDNMPGYSSSVVVSQGSSLETAIGALDAYVSDNSNYTLQKAYKNDADGSDAVITTDSTDGDLKVAGSEKLWVTATEGLKVDTKANFGTSVFDVQMQSGTGFSIDGAAASNVSTTTADLTLSTLTSGDVKITAATNIVATAVDATVNASGGISLNAVGASNLSASNGNMTIEAAGPGADMYIDAYHEMFVSAQHISLTASTDGIMLESHGDSDFTVAGHDLTLQTTGSGNVVVKAATNFDMNANGTATIDAASVQVTAGAAGNVDVDAGNQITFDDAALSHAVAMTRGSTGSVSTWSAGVSTAAENPGRDFSNMGIVEAINALGDGYTGLQGEVDSFTLQRAYDQGQGSNPDILIAPGDLLDFHLADATSEFQITSAISGINTLRVSDGYVQIDGYLTVTGGTIQVNTTVNDADHLLLSPGLSETVALKIEPNLSPAAYGANLIELWDGYQADGGQVVVSIDDDGNALFTKDLEVDQVLKARGSVDAIVTSFDATSSGTISLAASAASYFTVDGYDLTLSTTSAGSVVVNSASALDMNVVAGATLDAASINMTAANGDFSATSSAKVSVGAGTAIEFVDSGLANAVAVTRGAENTVNSWSAGVGDAYNGTANFATVGIVEAINALGDGYASNKAELNNLETSLGSIVDDAGNYVQRSGTNYLDHTLTIDQDLRALDSALKSNVDSITTAYQAEDGYVRAFIGKDSAGQETPNYNARGVGDSSVDIIGNNDDLELAIAKLDDGYTHLKAEVNAFTLQRAYDQDPDGSDALITTNSTDGHVAIAGTEGLRVTGDKGMVVGSSVGDVGTLIASLAQGDLLVKARFEADGAAQFNGATFDVNNSGAFTVDSNSVSIDATAASNFSTSAGKLTLSAGGMGSDLEMSSAAASTLTAGSSMTLHASAGDAYMYADGGDIKLSASAAASLSAGAQLHLKDSRSASTGAANGSFALSTDPTSLGFAGSDFSSVVRSLAGVSTGQELGIINAINAIGASSSSIEKAVYVVTAADNRLFDAGKTLKLNAGAGADRGSLELTPATDGYGVDFRPGRDLEVYVNGQLLLADSSQKTAGSVATDDYFLASDDATKITFAFTLVEGDVVVVKNLKPAPGEDVGTGWNSVL